MPSTLDSTWNECLTRINEEIPRRSFKTWFSPVSPVSLDRDERGAELVLSVPSRFFGEWIESNYAGVLRRVTADVMGAETRIFFEYQEDAPEPAYVTDIRTSDQFPTSSPQSGDGAETSLPAAPPRPPAKPLLQRTIPHRAVEPNLRPTYSFDSFIEGDCNRFARSAAVAIAEEPGGTSFNPLLIYGGVGLGKTHLVQAIGNSVLASKKTDRVLYISSEQFIAQFVRSIQQNNVSDFSDFYRSIDVLIVDDIQFFGGKEKTQEEFFHVFNTLHQSGKQIILCADRAPSEIPGIEERLLSRFQWGLTADVQPADFETRCAILQRKAERHSIELEQDVVSFIAENVTQNIRALEGALTRLIAQARLQPGPITLSDARPLLSDLVDNEPRPLAIGTIQEMVAQEFDVPLAQLSSRTRTRTVVTARHVAMYLAKELTTQSLKSIGLRFGGRDHSTVIHACNALDDRMDVDEDFRRHVAEIRSRIERQARTA